MKQRKDIPCVSAPCCPQHAEGGVRRASDGCFDGEVADAPDYCRIANRRAPRGGFTRRRVHQDVLGLIV